MRLRIPGANCQHSEPHCHSRARAAAGSISLSALSFVLFRSSFWGQLRSLPSRPTFSHVGRDVWGKLRRGNTLERLFVTSSLAKSCRGAVPLCSTRKVSLSHGDSQNTGKALSSSAPRDRLCFFPKAEIISRGTMIPPSICRQPPPPTMTGPSSPSSTT